MTRLLDFQLLLSQTECPMKYALLLIFIALCSLSTFAQDLIITNAGDSIECRIHQVRADQIIFVENINGRYEGRMLELTEVSAYHYNFQEMLEAKKEPSEVKVVQTEEIERASIAKHNSIDRRFDYLEIEEFDNGIPSAFAPSQQKSWQTSLSSGYSYQLGRIENNISPELEKHLHHLKHGFNVTLDFHRLGSAYGGAGMKASYFRSRNFSESGFLREITNILYAGISGIAFLSQNEIPHQGFFIDASIGLLYARQHLHGVPEIYAEGNSVGGQIGIGVDLKIKEDMSLFIKASLFAGSVRTILIHFENHSALLHREWKDRYSLSRIDLSGGIRF